MQILAYLLYLAAGAICVLLREYQLRNVAGGDLFNQNQLILTLAIVGGILLLAGFSFLLCRQQAKPGKSKLPGVIVVGLSVLILCYGGYSVYRAVTPEMDLFFLAVNGAYVALGLGLVGAGWHMKNRGKKPAGFLIMLTLVWPVVWLLYFVATKLIFIHQIADLLNLAFLLSGCLFYLELCSHWCVPDSTSHKKRTLFVGFLHMGLFAMANLPANINALARGDGNLDLYLNTAFFAGYLLAVFCICVYLRGAARPALVFAQQVPTKEDQPHHQDKIHKREEIAQFFGVQQPIVQQEVDWSQESGYGTAKKADEMSLFGAENEPQPILQPHNLQRYTNPYEKQEFSDQVQSVVQSDLPPQLDPTTDDLPADPVDEILKQVSAKKAMAQLEQKTFVYQPKAESKKPSRFKK